MKPVPTPVRTFAPRTDALPSNPVNPDAPAIPSLEDSPLVWQDFWRAWDIKPIPTYIAGGRSIIAGRNWRSWLEERLPIIGLDPFRDSKQDALYQFVSGDIEMVEQCELVIAAYFGGYASHGMAAEIGYAAAQSTPVFYIDESEQPDMFLVGLSKRFFPSMETCATWWARRVTTGIKVP